MRVTMLLLLLGLFSACSTTQSAPAPAGASASAPSGADEAAIMSGAKVGRSPGDRVHELHQRFQSILAERLKKANVEVSVDSGMLQRDFLLNGARRLVEDRASSDAISQAEQDVVRFADALIENATPTETGRRIGEGTFSKVRDLLCPLYPFC